MNTHTTNFLENPVSGSFCGAVLGQSAQILSRQCSPTPLSHAVDCGSPVLHAPLGSASQGFAHILPRTASLIPLSCTHNEVFGKPCFWGVFVERSLGSWLKFSANSAQPAPCHMQLTTACLCSTQGSFCRAVLEQSAQILSPQCLASTLSNAGDRGSPVLHMREIS